MFQGKCEFFRKKAYVLVLIWFAELVDILLEVNSNFQGGCQVVYYLGENKITKRFLQFVVYWELYLEHEPRYHEALNQMETKIEVNKHS